MLPEKKQNKSEILSDGNKLIQKPDDNELEVSVLGPGYGECILLHLGRNNWIIVDSCVFPGDSRPAPLRYLDKMNIEYDSVKAIIATHWHDDHMKGLGNVFKACRQSQFICSDALKNDEFLELIEIYGNSIIAEDSGVKEFHEILKEMTEINEKKEINYIPKFAVADRSLWKNSFKDNNGNDIITNLSSLSPCDAAILAAKLDIIKYLPVKNKKPGAIPAISSNHASVVLWLSFNDIGILLGADLEEEGNPYKGWSVIIDSRTRPNGKAIFYKVAHHGSVNAYHQKIWDDMLTDNPVAVLTPFSKGKKLPTIEGIEKICSHKSNAFITGDPFSKKKLKRNSAVEKTVKETAGKINMITPSYGHVRFRIKPEKDYRIELFGNAAILCN